MTLSRWFRDYVYIPLGGNRHGHLRTYVNLVAVFFLCGLWHGAGYTFVVWGLFHGLMLILERLAGRDRGTLPNGILGWCWAMVMVMVSWVIFRSSNLMQAVVMLKHMAFLGGSERAAIPILSFLPWDRMFYLIIGIGLALLPLERMGKELDTNRALLAVARVGSFVLFLFTVIAMSIGTFNPFIYFRF